jgi:L-seryl-tRNA(Ser) seleniumtransferase
LVEIGGGFRVPDVMRQSGARLVEVGTTNRTRIADYVAAITDQTGVLLAVHPSNFRIIGFTEAPTLRQLAALAHDHALPLIHDLGSGALLPTERYGLAHEPTVQESLEAGVDLVSFSGDKLLGGPQAGILVGRRDLIARISKHPLARALRVDKLSLAALEATLRAYREQNPSAIPVWRMIALTQDELRGRAERWVARLREAGIAASAIAGESTVGGGSLPGETLPTTLCAIAQAGERALPTNDKRAINAQSLLPVRDVGDLATRLRAADPPVVARVLHKRLLFDPRTVLPELDETLIRAVVAAVKGMQSENRIVAPTGA